MTIVHHEVRFQPLAQVGLILLACLALFFGMVSALLPAWFIFSALLVPAVAALMLVWPEYGLTALVALTCGLIHPAFVPRLPLLGGSVAASDAALVMLALCAVWMVAAQGDKARAESVSVEGARLLAVALGLFGVSFLVAVPVSLVIREVNPSWVLGEARRLAYLLALPVAMVILRQPERQRRFVISIVVLGCLFSIGQVFQGIFNIPVFGKTGSMTALETLGREDHGTTRSITLGIEVIVFALLLTVGAYVVGIIRKTLFFTLSGLLLLGIFLSYGRTTFAVVAVCLVTVVSWLNLRKLSELIMLFVLAICIAASLTALLKPKSLASIYYRMTSIDTEIESGYSAQWRFWEAEFIIPIIQKHPFIGVGLGADYKGSSGSSKLPDLNRYVHNGYLYMAGKMGLPALTFFLLAIATIFAMGRRLAKGDASPEIRVVSGACAAMMISFLLASVTEPHFMEDYSLVLIAIAGALVYLSARQATLARIPGPADRRNRFVKYGLRSKAKWHR